MGLLILLLHPSRRRLENANYPFSFWGCFWRRPCGVRVIRNGNLMTTVLVRSWQGDVYIPRGGPMTWWKLIWAVNRFHVYFIFARIICINFLLVHRRMRKKKHKNRVLDSFQMSGRNLCARSDIDVPLRWNSRLNIWKSWPWKDSDMKNLGWWKHKYWSVLVCVYACLVIP